LKSRYDSRYDAIVERLIAYGADVNVKSGGVMGSNRTPLDMVKPDVERTVNVFRLLSKAGGVNTTDEDEGRWFAY